MNTLSSSATSLPRSLGTWEVTVAGMALVVAASTLVSEFFTLSGCQILKPRRARIDSPEPALSSAS